MWADRVYLRAGGWIAGVRCDSVSTGDLVRAALRDRVIDPVELAGDVDVDTAFSLRDAGRNGREHSLAQLHIDSSLLARRRTLGGEQGALGALVGVIEGLTRYPAFGDAVGPDNRGRTVTPVACRLFVNSHGAGALVNVAQPLLVDDRWLLDRGIREVVCWQPWIDPVTATTTYPIEVPLVGAVSVDASGGVQGGCTPISDLWVLASAARAEWQSTLHRWEREARVVTVAYDDRIATRAALAGLLADKPTGGAR